MSKETIRADGMSDDAWHRAHGQRLRVARRNLGISEEEAAAAFKVTLRTYRKWENGGHCRADKHYVGVCNFFQKYCLPAQFYDWIYGGDEPSPWADLEDMIATRH